MKYLKQNGRRLLATIMSAVMCFGLLQTMALAAGTPPAGWSTSKPGGSSVSAYGTCIDGAETQAIISGPLYGSKWYNQVSTSANTNNYSYRIPQVSELFTIADGYELAYVSIAGNSSGQRQPGSTFLLSSSGGSMVYYFKRSAPVPVTYTLNYNANGGVGAPSAQSGSSTTGNYAFTISSATPTKSGCNFLGWSTNRNASEPSYFAGGRITVTSASTTLYAVWEEAAPTVSYTLRFDANGGVGAPADVTGSNTGTSYTFTIPGAAPTKDGFTFRGWATSRTAAEPAYQPNSSIVVSAGVTVLYALWEENAPARSVTRGPDGSMLLMKQFSGTDNWEEHPCVFVADGERILRYEIFAAWEPDVTSVVYRWDLDGEEARQELISQCLAASVIDTGIVPGPEDRLLTLSTCTGQGHETRWVVQGRLADEYPQEAGQ